MSNKKPFKKEKKKFESERERNSTMIIFVMRIVNKVKLWLIWVTWSFRVLTQFMTKQ